MKRIGQADALLTELNHRDTEKDENTEKREEAN